MTSTAPLPADLSPAPTLSASRRWTARALQTIAVLFLVFDGVTKLLQVEPVMTACAQLGLPTGLVVPIGVVLLAATALYVLPRTAVAGAVLLTGFLGGAIAIQLRAGQPVFASVVFPLVMATFVWAPLVLTDGRVRALIAPRR